MLQCTPGVEQVATQLEVTCNNHSHSSKSRFRSSCTRTHILGISHCTVPVCSRYAFYTLHPFNSGVLFRTHQTNCLLPPQMMSSNLKLLFPQVFAPLSSLPTVFCTASVSSVCFLSSFIAWVLLVFSSLSVIFLFSLLYSAFLFHCICFRERY